MADNHYDVIIIGTGAGGGTLAYRLAPSGKRILLLERGGYVPRERPRPPPAPQPRAAHPAAGRRLDPHRASAVPHARWRHARRAEPAAEPLYQLRHLRRLPVPRLREGARAGDLRGSRPRAPERHAGDRRVRVAPRDERVGTRGDEGPRRAERRPGDVLGGRRRRLVRGHQLGRAPPPLRERPAPPRPRQRLRRRRPPLHVPSQLDAPRRPPRAQPDALPEDLRPDRLLLPVEGVGLPDGAHLDDRED